jgi:hypothetical protein
MRKELYLDINEAYLVDLVELLKKHFEGLLDAEICEMLRISNYRLTLLRLLFERKREELDFQKKISWRKRKIKIGLNFLKYKHEQDVLDFLQAILQSSKIFQFVSILLQYENVSIHNMSSEIKVNEKKLRKVSKLVKDEFRRFSLIVSEKGLRLDGDEGVIRELLFQFWWQTKNQNYWPARFVDREVIKKIVDKMILRLTIVVISKSIYEELYLRVGVQMLRISAGYQYAKPLDPSLYLKTSKQYRKFCQFVKEHEALNNLRMEEIGYLYSLFIYLGVIPLTSLNLDNAKTRSCFNAVSALVDNLSFNMPSKQAKNLLNRLNFYLPIAKKAVLGEFNQQGLPTKSENFIKCLTLAKEVVKVLEVSCLDVYQLASYYFYLLKLPVESERVAKIYFANEEDEVYETNTKKEIKQVFQNFHSFQFVDESEKYHADIVLSHHHTEESYEEMQKQLFIKKKLDAYDFGRINKVLIEVSCEKKKLVDNDKMNW